METAKPDAPGQPKRPFGILRDIDQLKTQGGASVAELREFLGKMRGRRPEEVLGLIAGSRLTRSIVVATLGACVIFAVSGVGSYLLGKWQSAPAKPAAQAPQAALEKAPPSAPATVSHAKPAAADESPAKPPAQPSVNTDVTAADAEKAVKVMGLGETKAADPKKNPLESNLDNLLDKVE